jgi:hypothetical protein
MPEHHANPIALLAATYPPLLPPGHQCGIALHAQVVTKPNVLLCPPHLMRATADGKVELLRGEGTPNKTWEAPPEGFIVHELGKPLPAELCDVALVVGTAVRDQLSKSIVGLGGQAKPQTSTVVHGELLRVPLAEWQAQHRANLGGSGE